MTAVPTLDWSWAPGPASTPDVERMRRQRGERVRDRMAESGIDALILLDGANVAYATGATRPRGAGADVEGPVAVLLAEDPTPHLFTPFLADSAVELDLDDDHLHGPAYLDVAEGVEDFARQIALLVPHTDTIGVDEVTGAMRFFDDAIVDAGPSLRAIRRIKTDDEVAAICGAVRLADTAMASAIAGLRPGVTERELDGLGIDAMVSGDLVVLHATANAGGYLGEIARTLPVGAGTDHHAVVDATRRSDELWLRLLDACRPGAPASALLDAYRAAGEPLPVMPIGRGLGLGHDVPVIARHLPETAAIERLDPGVVLVVTACIFDDRIGSLLSREAVVITADGPEVLSSSPSWNRERVGAHT